jgi:hypothetical protein
MNIDGTFRPHQNGRISTTFTSDWYLHKKGENREKMGECLKKKQSDLKISGGYSK